MRDARDWFTALAAITLASVSAFAVAADAPGCKGVVHLTFDTGNMSQAELIARTLNEEEVKATFFLANERTFRGDHALDPSWDGYWRARAREGHAFGNHTWSHHTARRDEGDKVVLDNKSRLDQKAFCDELGKVDAAFRRATGRRLSGLWRAPGGRATANGIRFAAMCGFPLHAHWNEAGFLGDELPSHSYPNDKLLERALAGVRPGDVLMMHLGIWARADPFAPMLQPLIRGLKARGLCFQPLTAASR